MLATTLLRSASAVTGLIAALASPIAPAQELPPSLPLGEHVLALKAQGTREELLLDRYRLGVYLPPEASLIDVGQPDIPKSFLLVIGTIGQDREMIPGEWHHSLRPPLTEDQLDVLARHYEQLDEGDAMRIDYRPDSGTSVAMKGKVLLREPGHELFAGFTDIWLGATPVSEPLRNELIESAANWSE